MKRAYPHVVIVGGGFGGIYAARALKDAPVDITLIDRNNHHVFQPLLYQVATAGLSPGDIAHPIRSVLRKQRNTKVLLGNVVGVEKERNAVVLEDGELHYDYLILAAGVTNNYFGNDDWEEHAIGLKSLEEAIAIRRRFLMAFEQAERNADPVEQRKLLTFVVIGGGPTGVELAGAMGEIARKSLRKDFRNVDPANARILLIEGGERVLGTFDPSLSADAEAALEKLGVEILKGRYVSAITDHSVTVGDEVIPTRSVFWGAGVKGSPIGATLGVECDRGGRVMVKPDLTIEGGDNVYVIGDMASLTDVEGKHVPGVAPGAIQMGEYAADDIKARLEDRRLEPFIYNDKGSLATIGRNAGVAEVGEFKLSGYLAWLFWAFIHLVFLIGFKNRILVLLQWSWSYFTFKRGARLITHAENELHRWNTITREDLNKLRSSLKEEVEEVAAEG